MTIINKTISIAAILTASIAMPITSNAQSLPDDLYEILEKKYSERTVVVTENTENGWSGSKFGPYLYQSRVTALGGASRLSKPTKFIKKYCEETQSGSFVQTAQILSDYKLSVDPITITENGQQYSLTSNDILYLTHTFKSSKGKQAREGWISQNYFHFKKESAKGKLGVFQCNNANGDRMWSIAIMPNRYFSIESRHSANSANYKQSVSILPLDGTALKVLALEESLAQQREQDKQQDKALKEALKQDIRTTADVGTETSCGLVIDKRGPLVQVDLKAEYARRSGKDTAWIKKQDLLPDTSGNYCTLN